MKQIRVLQIGMHDKIGGIETFLMTYYRNIDRKILQFDFINMYDKLCFQEEIEKMGGKVYQITNVKKNPYKYYVELRNIIKKNNYKIVHINMLSMANILPIIAAYKEGVKHIILHSHNTGTPKGILRKILDKINKKMAIKYATDYFACSKLAGDWLYGKKNQFEVINNAIEIEKFKYNDITRKKIREELEIGKNIVIGHVGRFCEQKNHKFLIEVFNELVKIKPNYKLLLIGEGKLKQKIVEQIKKLGIEEKVVILPPKRDIQDYYQAMDIFTLPSKFEGLGIVLVEAQANGLQCICSDVVPNEVKVINTLQRIPLKKDEWLKALVNAKNRVNNNTVSKNLKMKNYDITIEAKKLMNRYINYMEDGI